MAEVEYAGVKMSGSKLLIILPLLGTLIGGLWGGFEVYNRLLEAEAKLNISNFRNSLLDKLFKGREAYEKRQFQCAFDRLYKWNQLCSIKQAIIKNMFRKMLGKNDSVL